MQFRDSTSHSRPLRKDMERLSKAIPLISYNMGVHMGVAFHHLSHNSASPPGTWLQVPFKPRHLLPESPKKSDPTSQARRSRTTQSPGDLSTCTLNPRLRAHARAGLHDRRTTHEASKKRETGCVLCRPRKNGLGGGGRGKDCSFWKGSS